MLRHLRYPMIVAALLFIGAARNARAEGDTAPPPLQKEQRGRGGNRGQFMLKHAGDLNLTDEQKTKLDALVKESDAGGAPTPESSAAQKEKLDAVLTDAQREKMKELFKARQAERSTGADAADVPKPPPPVPHIEDKVRAADVLQFILGHQTELFLRTDQKELFAPLSADPAKAGAGDSDGGMKKQIWDILTGQQIGKLREMLKTHPELQKVVLAPMPAK